MSETVLEVMRTRFKPRACDAWMFAHPELRALLELQAACGPAYALPSLDNPQAIAGLGAVCGVGSVWMVTGERFRRFSPVIAGQLEQLCHAAIAVFNLHRLQMLVDSDRPDAKFFAEKIGFVCEAANLKKLGARGQDIDLYRFERNQIWAV